MIPAEHPPQVMPWMAMSTLSLVAAGSGVRSVGTGVAGSFVGLAVDFTVGVEMTVELSRSHAP